MQSSDRHVVDALFAEQHVIGNSHAILGNADSSQERQRYLQLKRWVLPNAVHRLIRVNCDFRQGINTESYDPKQSIASPLRQLLDLAKTQNNLPTLLQECQTLRPTVVHESIKRDVMIGLLLIRLGQQEQAIKTLNTALATFIKQPVDRLSHRPDSSRDAVLLALVETCSHPSIARDIASFADRIDRRYAIALDQSPWHRHLFATVNLVHLTAAANAAAEDSATTPTSEIKTKQWHWVPQLSAQSIGRGDPYSRWRLHDGKARSTQAGGKNALFFASPLTGAIDVEAKIVGSGFRRGHARIFDEWVTPGFSANEFEVQNDARQKQSRKITPPFIDDGPAQTIRYRSTGDPSDVRTYFNGRLVHQGKSLATDNPPSHQWLRLHSCFRPNSGMDDIRVAGKMIVPRTIRLLGPSARLEHWHDFYGTSQGTGGQGTGGQGTGGQGTGGQGTGGQGTGGWTVATENAESSPELRSRRDTRLPEQCHAQQLLVYGRPIFEDGQIEYDFWYRQGDAVVHPAIGLTAVLIDQEVPASHEITLGKYDRSLARSDNRRLSEQTKTLPLIDQQWNRMRIEIVGDKVDFYLNEQPIFTLQVPAGYRRTFGLFHYRDQSRVRVRDVTWKGNWSTTVPPVAEQELSQLRERSELQATEHMTASFSHTFDAASLRSGFRITDGANEATFDADENGLTVVRPAIKAYREAKVAVPISIQGDFDVTASFDSLDIAPATGNNGLIMLEVRTEDPMSNVGMVQLRRHPTRDPFIQSLHLRKIKGDEVRKYSPFHITHANSGRLKLSRRGETLYVLLAENDSPHFHPIAEIAFSSADVSKEGIRLGSQIQGTTGQTTVRWTKIDVQSETLQQDNVIETMGEVRTIAELDQERSELTEEFSYQFGEEALPTGVFDFWNRNQSPGMFPGKDGLTVVSPGTEGYTSAGPLFIPVLQGNYDITVEFDPSGLAVAKAGEEASMCLQLGPVGGPQVSVFCKRSLTGFLATTSKRVRTARGRYEYSQLGTVDAEPDQLRIAVRGKTTYLIEGDSKTQRQSIVGQSAIKSSTIERYGIRILVHTSDPEQTSKLLIQSLKIRSSMPIPVKD